MHFIAFKARKTNKSKEIHQILPFLRFSINYCVHAIVIVKYCSLLTEQYFFSIGYHLTPNAVGGGGSMGAFASSLVVAFAPSPSE